MFHLAGRILNYSTHDFLRPQRSVVGNAQRHIVRLPDIKVKPILNIQWEKLRFELRASKTASQQENRRSEENGPSMLNRPTYQAVIQTIKTTLALLLQRGFSPGRRPLNVVAQEWNEGHGYY